MTVTSKTVVTLKCDAISCGHTEDFVMTRDGQPFDKGGWRAPVISEGMHVRGREYDLCPTCARRLNSALAMLGVSLYHDTERGL